jgi:hypothetical protein
LFLRKRWRSILGKVRQPVLRHAPLVPPLCRLLREALTRRCGALCVTPTDGG